MKLVKTGSPDEISLIYSLDNENWDDWNYSVGTTLKVGEKIFLKSKSEKQSFSTGEQNYLTFSSTNKFNACGNTMSLIYNDFIEKKSLTSRFCFLGLFQKSSIINVENLKLPATSLTYFCYGYMFDDCENLIYGPELPSEELAEWCYARMFRDCCVLRETPRLKSTGYMPNRCYSAMF